MPGVALPLPYPIYNIPHHCCLEGLSHPAVWLRAGIQDSKLMGSTSPTRRTFSPTRSSPTAGTGSTDRGPGSAYRASRMSYEDLAMDQFSKEKIMDKLEDARGECRIMAAKLADAQADLR